MALYPLSWNEILMQKNMQKATNNFIKILYYFVFLKNGPKELFCGSKIHGPK